MDGAPTNCVMKDIDGLIPRTNGNTSTPTVKPFLPISGKEGETAVGSEIPFLVTGIVKN